MTNDEFWVNEFGNKDSGKDFAGQTVRRDHYIGNFKQGSNLPSTAWDREDIEPLNPNGSEKHKRQHNDISNLQVVNVATNRAKENKTFFTIDGVLYQVVKNTPKRTRGKRLAPYSYKGKKYCIVILDK
ncbi:MAG: hypothetical protein LBT00_08725 [Spirochaetaceae bacterium]|jgi:hypothetical protein|nr:hypothetical protein [Spirochaetaceae bacterium]